VNSIEPQFAIGIELRFQNLSIVPLIGLHWSERTYDTLDEALRRDALQIREVSEAGSVPEVAVKSSGRQPSSCSICLRFPPEVWVSTDKGQEASLRFQCQPTSPYRRVPYAPGELDDGPAEVPVDWEGYHSLATS
jgi:hypothetical protein